MKIPLVETSPVLTEDRLLQVIGYHQETKHHFFRYARSLGYLDWANQPNPFRRFEGAPVISLPILKPQDDPVSPPYEDIYRPGAVASQPVNLRTLSRFLEYTLAISAWKQAGGTRWALRSNPSSGNLHPTEGYLLLDGLPGIAPTPGLYHYAPKEHALERRAEWAPEVFSTLMAAFPPDAFLLAFTSIHWREAWKYGERAYRYCQHDAGHAIGAARIAAAALGWKMMLLEDLSDDLLAVLLGLNRADDFAGAESEHPDCLAVVWPAHLPQPCPELPLSLDEGTVERLVRGKWYGKANQLSQNGAIPWEIIDVVAAAACKPPTGPRTVPLLTGGGRAGEPGNDSRLEGLYPGRPLAGQVIRQRRSALAFDGKTSISAESFFLMLSRVLPRRDRPLVERPMPWDAIPWDPAVHLGFFVHRVDGLRRGLYMLVRDEAKLEELRRRMHASFLWTRPAGCPEDLPLFLLQEGDARRLATQVSCHQEIAGDGAFSLGMIAEFEACLRRYGPWFYRRLFWETGVIGQVLYLEAEATGVRATGIGCFFDDPVHQVFGLTDQAFQSLYHFTVGGPIEDPRLTTLPAYGE